MQEKLISIIIPIYNASHYIQRCITGLRRQKWKNFEIILVNDGSSDGSTEICDELAKTNRDIKVIHKKNEGPFLARKTGVLAATGEYIGFIDVDDYMEPQMYSLLYEEISSNRADCAICDFFAQSGPFKIKVTYPAKAGYYDRVQIEQEILPSILYADKDGRSSIVPAVWAKLFRSEILKQAFQKVSAPLRYGEDHFQTVLFFQIAQSCYILDKQFLYHYIVHPHSTMTSYKKGYLDNVRLLHEEYRKLIPFYPSSNLNKQINAHYCWDLCNIIHNNSRLKEPWKMHKAFIDSISQNAELAEYIQPQYFNTYAHKFRTIGRLFFKRKYNRLATKLWFYGLLWGKKITG